PDCWSNHHRDCASIEHDSRSGLNRCARKGHGRRDRQPRSADGAARSLFLPFEPAAWNLIHLTMPTELMQRGANEADSEMLPQDPPPWFVRSTAWLLIALFAVALLAAV